MVMNVVDGKRDSGGGGQGGRRGTDAGATHDPGGDSQRNTQAQAPEAHAEFIDSPENLPGSGVEPPSPPKQTDDVAPRTGPGGGDDVVDLYRFVSPAEFDDIARTGQFRFAPGQMEAKQFGFNMDEVLKLSDHFPDAAAIMKAQVPRSTLQRLDLTPVDSSILRSGSATALGAEQLQLLNQSLLGPIKHAF